MTAPTTPKTESNGFFQPNADIDLGRLTFTKVESFKLMPAPLDQSLTVPPANDKVTSTSRPDGLLKLESSPESGSRFVNSAPPCLPRSRNLEWETAQPKRLFVDDCDSDEDEASDDSRSQECKKTDDFIEFQLGRRSSRQPHRPGRRLIQIRKGRNEVSKGKRRSPRARRGRDRSPSRMSAEDLPRRQIRRPSMESEVRDNEVNGSRRPSPSGIRWRFPRSYGIARLGLGLRIVPQTRTPSSRRLLA